MSLIDYINKYNAEEEDIVDFLESFECQQG